MTPLSTCCFDVCFWPFPEFSCPVQTAQHTRFYLHDTKPLAGSPHVSIENPSACRSVGEKPRLDKTSRCDDSPLPEPEGIAGSRQAHFSCDL